jgi:hypothetical protein
MKDFPGAHAKADLVFQDDEIRLKSMTVEQSSGTWILRDAEGGRMEMPIR